MLPNLPDFAEAIAQYVDHCEKHPDTVRLIVGELRRPSGLQETDAGRALLAEVVQSIGKLLEGKAT